MVYYIHKERKIWSQERVLGFVERLLLGLWMKKEFRKQTRVTYTSSRFLCERLGPYLKKKMIPVLGCNAGAREDKDVIASVG